MSDNAIEQVMQKVESTQRFYDELIQSHDAEIRYQKSLSWTSGAYTSALFITLALIAAHAIGFINLIGACK